MTHQDDTNTIDPAAFGVCESLINNLDGAEAVLSAAYRRGVNVDCRTCGAVIQLLATAKEQCESLLSKRAPIDALTAQEVARSIDAATELAFVGLYNDRGDDDEDSGLNEPLAWLAARTIGQALAIAEAVRDQVQARIRSAEAVVTA
jgi:hypothetical protein